MIFDVPSKSKSYDSMNLISEIINKNTINHNTSQSDFGEAFLFICLSENLQPWCMKMPHGKLIATNKQYS